MKLIVNAVIASCVFALATAIGDDVDVDEIPQCEQGYTDCKTILSEEGMVCNEPSGPPRANYDPLKSVCCSSKNMSSILPNVEEDDTRCVCCGGGYDAPNSQQAATDPCKGECFRPMWTSNQGGNCDADNNDCDEIFKQKGLTCNSQDSPAKSPAYYAPRCCSASAPARILEDGTRSPAQSDVDCFCCPSRDGDGAHAPRQTCPDSCVPPSPITQPSLVCNVEEEDCAAILQRNGVLCRGSVPHVTFTPACCSGSTSGSPAHRAEENVTRCVCCSPDGDRNFSQREEDPCQGYCFDPLNASAPQH